MLSSSNNIISLDENFLIVSCVVAGVIFSSDESNALMLSVNVFYCLKFK